MLSLVAAQAACKLVNDDEPTLDGGGTTDGGGQACLDSFVEIVQNQGCPFPTTPIMAVDFGDDAVFWVDDPSNATTIGPLGWLFGNVASADWLAYMVLDDGSCQIACAVPEGSPCFEPDNAVCNAGQSNPGCMYCGDISPSECESFVVGACNPGSGGADSTGVDSTGASDGGLDSTGAGAGPGAPDVTMFTNHPNTLFGTTTQVLNRLGPYAPPNLVAEDLCDAWDPNAAIDDWFGDPLVDRAAFYEVADTAERVLDYCDHLKVSLVTNGIRLTDVAPGTLAAGLGFRVDDVLLDLNGVAATDTVGMISELMALSDHGGSAGITFMRKNKNKFVRVVVQ